MNVPHANRASSVPSSTPPAGPKTTAPAATAAISSSSRLLRRSCAPSGSSTAHDAARGTTADRVFLLLLIPLAAASLPSLVFCLLQLAFWAHGAVGAGTIEFHLPPQNAWDSLFALQASVHGWVARWNSLATIAATAVFVCTLLRPRWRHWAGLALVPYGVLLCADFTLRWRSVLLP